MFSSVDSNTFFLFKNDPQNIVNIAFCWFELFSSFAMFLSNFVYYFNSSIKKEHDTAVLCDS